MAVSQAQIKAVRKYEKAHYDSVSLQLPKGTKDKIKSTGESINGFIVKAVLEKLEKEGL